MDHHCLAGRRRVPRDRHHIGILRTGHGDVRNRAHRRHARHRRNFLHEAVEEPMERIEIVIAAPGQVELSRQHVIGPETGSNIRRVLETDAEQGRAREQHERQRDLRDDEPVTQALRGAAGCAAA